MRNLLAAFVFLFFLVSSDLHAQYFRKHLKILPSYTGQIDQVDQWYWTEDYIGRSGWDLGIEARYGSYWYVQSGVHYFRFNREIIAEPHEWSYMRLSPELRTDGIYIPLKLGFDVLGWGDFGIRGFGGPSMHLYRDGTDNGFSNTRWGMQAGVGFDLAVVAIDFTYNFTLANLDSTSLLRRSDIFGVSFSALLDWPRYNHHRRESD